MSHHPYPHNPSVPHQASVTTANAYQPTFQPPRANTVPMSSVDSGQYDGSGGRIHAGPIHPVPPTSHIHPAVNYLASGLQQMNIRPTSPSGQSIHLPPPPTKTAPYGTQFGTSASAQLLPPPPTAGQVLGSGLGSGLTASQSSMAYSSSAGSGVPPSSGQLSRQVSGHQTSGQMPSSGQVSGDVYRHNSKPGLLPTPPASGHGLLPAPSSGQGLLPPPPVSGRAILPNPTQSGQGGLLPPPPTQSGQGLLPRPALGQPPPPPVSSNYPPPPTTRQGPGQNYYSGQGILPNPPTSGQAPPPMAGHAAPPPVGSNLPPPGQSQQPLGQVVGHGGGSSMPPPPPTGQGLLRQVPPSSSAMPPQHSQVSHPPHPSHPPHLPHPSHPPHPPHPSQSPSLAATDPELKPVNMMESRNVMPSTPLTPPKIVLPGGLGVSNPKPEVMCSTMNAVPTTSGLLSKMKLPLAIHIHPYKDLSMMECPVIHPTTIVRCRVCRAYINPFVVFIDSRHWRCNLCFRPNALPDDFDCNSHTGKHGDRSQRMEVKRSSVEYIAPSEYMMRPPQPCVYFFVIDVSYSAVQSGVLALTCRCLLDCLDRFPGDARTLVGFLTCDSSLHFYNLSVANSQPQMMIVSDVDDVFLPSPDSLLVNLKESKDIVRTLLEDLPGMFAETSVTQSALGAAIQVAERLLHSIGGRVTVVQSCLPNVGPGALKNRDVTPSATKKDTLKMAPASDFYKKLALELSSQQIAVDLFCLSSQFIDLSTLSCVSKFSSGQIFHYPDFHHSQLVSRERFEKDFIRYLTRKIGFESVMRIRCTEGLSLHTFHGNFFVRSTDLLSLPNTNPDHGYTISLAIDENLKDMSNVCFQAALLYTSSRGERRIRVHTLCLPVSSQPSVLYSKLNVRAIVGVLANMGVDRATTSSIGDAREALLNTVVDCTKMYRSQVASANCPPFTLPSSLAQLPLLILSLLKNPAFTLNSRITYDVRAQTMNMMKSHPLYYLMPTIYPHLYALHMLTEQSLVESEQGVQVVEAPLLQLSPENVSRYGIFLMDCGLSMYIWVSSDAPPQLIKKILGVDHFDAIPEDMTSLPQLENELSKMLNMLVKQIRHSRQYNVSLLVIRERGPKRLLFLDQLLDGKTEDGTSYYEFLSHILRQIGK